jgi:hypothetical protein
MTTRGYPEGNDLLAKTGRAVTSFLESPVTNLVKGVLLMLIGLSEAVHTLGDDLAHFHPRVGHGLVIIGFFSVLAAVPEFIEGVEAGRRYVASRGGNREDEPPAA